MFEKYYGVCDILGDYKVKNVIDAYMGEREFEVLFEFRKIGMIDAESKEYIGDYVIGKDIITGTPLYLRNKYVIELEQAAEKKMIRKGKLIILFYKQISEKEMKEKLQSMSKEDIEQYVKRINSIKEKYAKARINAKEAKKQQRANSRNQSRLLNLEKGRVKELVRNIHN